jgi:hypothetical protein
MIKSSRSKELVSILLNVFRDTDDIIELLFNCFKKLKIFRAVRILNGGFFYKKLITLRI